MKFTKIPSDTFQKLQLNAGILATEFTPATGEVGPDSQIGATTGGINFTAAPTYSDMGENIDNCPKNIQYSYQPRENVVASTQNWAFYS
jgi:hypothetical protein|nr:MAG TPA: major tail protein [Caudoviricetes sp.]